MSSSKPVIGIMGAGKLGITLGQLATKAGYTVCIAGSGDAQKIALSVEVLVPGAHAVTSLEVAENADIIILALPLGKFKTLPKDSLRRKLVIDAMNHWWEVDGPREDFIPLSQSSSEAVQQYLAGSRVIKALNHMGYHHLHDETKPQGAPGRKAIAVAGDSKYDIKVVEQFINDLGFDPLYIGKLAEGRRLETGTSAFGANLTSSELKKII